MKYKLGILGAGPAGLSAALYAGRQNLKTAVTAEGLGGQIVKSQKMENYPGLPDISGEELIKRIKKQVDQYSIDFIWGKAEKVKKENDLFVIEIPDKDKNVKAESVILAFGKSPRQLNVRGEDKFIGKGVSYCAICDMAFFVDKTVAIVGGGNSALHAVLTADKMADKIYLIHRREKFRVEKSLLKKVKEIEKTDKLKILTNSVVKKINGDKMAEAIEVKNKETKKQKEIKVNGVFIEIGFKVNTKLVEGLVDFDDNEEIITEPGGATKTEGLFAAGDLSANVPDQAVIAAGQGACAGVKAYRYLKGERGKSLSS